MTDNDTNGEEESLTVLSTPLQLARQYLDNARSIGEPGSPSMTEAGELQRQHAEMARTAALISMAESLHEISRYAKPSNRRLNELSHGIKTLADEITKIRYIVRK
jgi:hypothetical protein